MSPAKREKTERERQIEMLKLDIAEELGLTEKIRQGGWGELNAVESGKIGGILSSRLKGT